MQDALGEDIQGQTVTPGQRLFYTVTLTGESDEMMEDPILADVLPAGLTPVEGGIEAETNSTTLKITGTRQAGQNVWVTTAGKLAQGDTPVSYTHLDVYKRQPIPSRRRPLRPTSSRTRPRRRRRLSARATPPP